MGKMWLGDSLQKTEIKIVTTHTQLSNISIPLLSPKVQFHQNVNFIFAAVEYN
jgi:hypothetical protein